MAVNRISSGWENAMGRIEEFELPIEPLAQSPRKIWVYLPDDYDESRKRYPVLYMFDGHNLFDDSLATYGKSWGIRDYLDGTHLPLVVIGQDCNHTGNARLEEYSPFQPDSHTWIGKHRRVVCAYPETSLREALPDFKKPETGWYCRIVDGRPDVDVYDREVQ